MNISTKEMEHISYLIEKYGISSVTFHGPQHGTTMFRIEQIQGYQDPMGVPCQVLHIFRSERALAELGDEVVPLEVIEAEIQITHSNEPSTESEIEAMKAKIDQLYRDREKDQQIKTLLLDSLKICVAKLEQLNR